MKAFYYLTSVTDLVRNNNTPRINDIEKGLYTDLEDWRFDAYIRFIGIHSKYPTAKFRTDGNCAYVFVDGVLVYKSEIIAINPEPVEVDAWDEPIGTDFA